MQELLLTRTRLSDGYLPSLAGPASRAGASVVLRPLRRLNDTFAVFRIPSGLRSGMYAATIKQGSLASQGFQYIMIMQQEIDERFVESAQPSDLTLTN